MNQRIGIKTSATSGTRKLTNRQPNFFASKLKLQQKVDKSKSLLCKLFYRRASFCCTLLSACCMRKIAVWVLVISFSMHFSINNLCPLPCNDCSESFSAHGNFVIQSVLSESYCLANYNANYVDPSLLPINIGTRGMRHATGQDARD